MLLLAALGFAACTNSRPPPKAAAPLASAPPAPVPRSLTPAEIAARAFPAVVTIRSAGSLGTGFVVRSDGWIATNMHVVVGGPKVKVTMRTAQEFDVVELIAASPEHDLALVRVEARGLSSLALGDSDRLRPGDPIVAIGNPLGFEDTVSNGLVSARRTVEGGSEVLQISAPIAPGSSGGPIFNDRGEVIGIATAIVAGGQNLNFGIPVRYLAPMMKKPAPMPFAEFATLIARLRQVSATRIDRNVPHHPLSILEGCPVDSQKLVVRMIGDAIDAGAPLFNAHKPDACYHVYDGAASDLGRRLPVGCRGPARLLAEAQKRAATLASAAAQAWAMRDAFDGLLEVIARQQDTAQP